jgi:hypothetical protein
MNTSTRRTRTVAVPAVYPGDKCPHAAAHTRAVMLAQGRIARLARSSHLGTEAFLAALTAGTLPSMGVRGWARVHRDRIASFAREVTGEIEALHGAIGAVTGATTVAEMLALCERRDDMESTTWVLFAALGNETEGPFAADMAGLNEALARLDATAEKIGGWGALDAFEHEHFARVWRNSAHDEPWWPRCSDRLDF